jgi:hypothetical protein
MWPLGSTTYTSRAIRAESVSDLRKFEARRVTHVYTLHLLSTLCLLSFYGGNALQCIDPRLPTTIATVLEENRKWQGSPRD